MARFLGIDYGTERMGFALSDPEGLFAFPFLVLEVKKENIIERIREIIVKEGVERIVLGLPIPPSRVETAMTREVRAFGDTLRKEMTPPLYFAEELFSSKEASRTQGANNPLLDASAAAIILQGFLDQRAGT